AGVGVRRLAPRADEGAGRLADQEHRRRRRLVPHQAPGLAGVPGPPGQAPSRAERLRRMGAPEPRCSQGLDGTSARPGTGRQTAGTGEIAAGAGALTELPTPQRARAFPIAARSEVTAPGPQAP